jgi:hypothetical protein
MFSPLTGSCGIAAHVSKSTTNAKTLFKNWLKITLHVNYVDIKICESHLKTGISHMK